MKIKGLLTTVSVGTALMFASSLMAQTVEKNVVQPDPSIWTLDRCIDYAMTCQRKQKKWQIVPARTKRCQTMCE